MTNDSTPTVVGTPGAGGLDLRAFARILWRWKLLLLTFVVIIPVATYFYERSQPKVYRSGALMNLSGGSQLGVGALFNQIVVNQGPSSTSLDAEARLITTPHVAREAATYLHPRPRDPASLLGSISASADQNTGFITITASSANPRHAADLANAFAQAVVVGQAQSAVNQITSAIRQLRKQIRAISPSDPGRLQLSEQLARFRALRAAQSGDAQIIEPAVPSFTPVSPRVTRSVILSFVLALLLGLGAVAVAETADRRVRNADQVGDFTGLPLLSAIPEDAFSRSGETHGIEEAFATLRASLTYFNIDRRISSVLITSPGKQDGKTTVSVRLAQALARAGKRVILLDADLRRPAAASRLGLPPSQGLGALLVGELSLDEALLGVASQNGGHGTLQVLPAGPPPPNPSELLGSSRMLELLSQLQGRCDILVIDSTPLLTVSDSIPLLPVVSGVVLIARVDRTSRHALARLRFVVDSAGGNALGAVAAGAPTGGLYVAPGYGYDTAYAAAEHTNGRRRRRLWGRGARRDAEQVGVAERE